MAFPDLSGGPRRTNRSYELRQGRLTAGQQRAIEEHWKEFGVEAPPGPLALDRIFGRRAPRVLDIGSGMGETTAALAQRHPENDFLAIEVHLPGIGALIRRAVELRLRNLRIMRADARAIVCERLADASLDEAWIFFPDPWVKRRQHKRRLVNAELASALARCLKPNGRLLLATDWEDLAIHMRDACDAEPGLRNMAGAGKFAPRPAWRPVTKFEQRGHRLGHRVFDLVYSRTASAPSNAAKEPTEGNASPARGGDLLSGC